MDNKLSIASHKISNALHWWYSLINDVERKELQEQEGLSTVKDIVVYWVNHCEKFEDFRHDL